MSPSPLTHRSPRPPNPATRSSAEPNPDGRRRDPARGRDACRTSRDHGSPRSAGKASLPPPRRNWAWLDATGGAGWSDAATSASAALARTLAGTGRGGAILTGEAGDRRDTIESVISDLPAERSVFRLHGSAFAAATPYGALAILLSGLDSAPPATPHGMLRALSGLLCPADGAPAVVIVSQADQLDPGTVTVLAQLAQAGVICLVVHGERRTDLPMDFVSLLRAGRLDGIAVRPLTPTAALRLVEEILGEPVSRFAATILWRHSGGSVHRLRLIVNMAVASGKLHRTRGGWVLASGELPRLDADPGLKAALRRLPGRQRSLLEMLTVCGPMPVIDLVHIGLAHELDDLQDAGLLRIRADHSGRLVELGREEAAGTLAAIEPDHRRELSATLHGLDPEFRGVLRTAYERFMTGDAAGAVTLFEDAGWKSSADGGALGEAALTHLVWAESRSRSAAGDLDGAAGVVAEAPMDGSAVLSVLDAGVDLSRGDVRAALARLDHMPTEAPLETLTPQGWGFTGESVRCRAQALQAEALALGNDQEGALRLLDRLEADLSRFQVHGILDDVVSAVDRSVIAQSMLDVLYLCGRLERCRELAGAIIAGDHGNPFAAQYAELVLAIVDATTGERERAHGRAQRLVAQLEVLGNPQELHVARAVLVFSADTEASGDSAEVIETSPDGQPEPGGERNLGRMGWLAELMLAWAGGRADSAQPRGARMLALADRAARAGLHAVEVAALAGAVQCGELQLAGRLDQAASAIQTAVSGPTRMLARSILREDPDLLVRAFEGFAAAGYSGHFDYVVPSLLGSVPPQSLRRITDRAAAAGPPEASAGDGGTDPGWMEPLTRREREVAGLAIAGKSNATIARVTGTSVRTAEGHLHQIYAKLQVRGRSDLARLAAAQERLRAGR